MYNCGSSQCGVRKLQSDLCRRSQYQVFKRIKLKILPEDNFCSDENQRNGKHYLSCLLTVWNSNSDMQYSQHVLSEPYSETHQQIHAIKDASVQSIRLQPDHRCVYHCFEDTSIYWSWVRETTSYHRNSYRICTYNIHNFLHYSEWYRWLFFSIKQSATHCKSELSGDVISENFVWSFGW